MTLSSQHEFLCGKCHQKTPRAGSKFKHVLGCRVYVCAACLVKMPAEKPLKKPGKSLTCTLSTDTVNECQTQSKMSKTGTEPGTCCIGMTNPSEPKH